MKTLLIAFLLLCFSFNSLALDRVSGMDFIEALSPEEREVFEESLETLEVSDNFVKGICLEIDQESSTVNLNIGEATLNERLWVMSVGAGYFFPMGPGVNFQLQPGLKNTRIVLDAMTSGQFSRGSVQTYSATSFYKFGRSGVYIGPVIQGLHIYNPLLNGQKSFFYKAYGLALGEELKPKIFNKKWTLQIYGQATIGGLSDTMVPFMIVGAGARINLPVKR